MSVSVRRTVCPAWAGRRNWGKNKKLGSYWHRTLDVVGSGASGGGAASGGGISQFASRQSFGPTRYGPSGVFSPVGFALGRSCIGRRAQLFVGGGQSSLLRCFACSLRAVGKTRKEGDRRLESWLLLSRGEQALAPSCNDDVTLQRTVRYMMSCCRLLDCVPDRRSKFTKNIHDSSTYSLFSH